MAMVWTALLAVLVACATAQENPFGEGLDAPTQSEPAAAAPAEPELAPAAPRRLAISGFSFGIKDSNGTDISDGEEIASFEVSFTIGAADTKTAVVSLPNGIFKTGMDFSNVSLAVGDITDANASAGGRRLAGTCTVTGTLISTCASTSVGGTGTCLTLTLGDSSNTANPCATGSTVSASLASADLAAVTNAVSASNLNIDVNTYKADGTALESAAVVFSVLTQAGIAISDPITFYKGKKTKFWLPLEGKHLLLQTPDLAIYATVLPGPKSDLQWFDRFFLHLGDGRKVAEVGVKRSLGQNRSRQHRVFNQLDIKLGESWESLQKLQPTLYSANGGAVKLAVGTQKYDPPRLHGQPITEFVNVETQSISFVLVASHAGNEFPDDIELQKKYSHLDWITREMIGTKSFTGILPQIWGVQQPLSAEVAAMLQSPSESTQICAEV